MSGRVLQRHVKQCRSEEEYDTGKDFRVDRIWSGDRTCCTGR